MSPVSLNTNIASLRAIRRLGESSRELSSTFERLSSGLRINSASDDAAGLAVASILRSDARVYAQAHRNLNDGISYLNVAEGATSELKNILFRLRELATQSSSGTFSDTQRGSLDVESRALQAEYTRIVDSSKYNGIAIFSTGQLAVQAGYGTNAVLTATIDTSVRLTGALGPVTPPEMAPSDRAFRIFQDLETAVSALADVNGDSILDVINASQFDAALSIYLGNGDGTLQARVSYDGGTNSYGVTVADVNSDGKADLISAAYGDSKINVFLGNGDGSFNARVSYDGGTGAQWVDVADLNGDGKLDIASASYLDGKVSIQLGVGDWTFGARTSYDGGADNYSAEIGDVNNDGIADIVTAAYGSGTANVLLGNGDGTFSGAGAFAVGANPWEALLADMNGDGKLDIVSGSEANGTVSVLMGNGDGTFAAQLSYNVVFGAAKFLAIGDLDGDGRPDVVTEAFAGQILLNNGDGTLAFGDTYTLANASGDVRLADLDNNGALDIVSAVYGAPSLEIRLGNAVTAIGETSGPTFSLATASAALDAQSLITAQLERVTAVTSSIGVSRSRFEVAARVVSVTNEVYRAAESRIIDADIALESANLTRLQILQQTAAAVLAQANQEPQIALRLLKV